MTAAEKWQLVPEEAYLTIPTLGVYLMLDPDEALAVVHRRTATGFDRSIVAGVDGIVSLPEVDIDLPLAEVSEGVDFEA